jgi:RNA polymerase sigma-70 factor (ECF subfamily)
MDARERQAVEWANMMRAAQDGDSAAYNRLLREIAPAIRRIVGNRMPNSADAEDVVQDVLLSVHAVRHTYDPDRPFLPWLMAITRHRVMDRLRRIGRRAAHETVVDEMPETFFGDEANTPENTLAAGAALEQAIARLPPGQRQAIELLKLKEMSLKEASAASGTSVSALKVATHRAIKALRLALHKDP